MSDALTGSERFDNWSDRFSPMLIKELRQGMQTRHFGFSFMLLQGLMVISIFLGFSDAARKVSALLFWGAIAIPVLLIFPLRGSRDVLKGPDRSALELLLLSRLSPYRIVSGKWNAVLIQSLLLAVSVMPYLFLRYFIGAVDLMQELVLVISLVAASAVLSAINVCGSTYRTPGARALLSTAAYAILCILGSLFAGLVYPAVGYVSTGQQFVIFVVSILLFLLLAAFLLAWASDRIAPPACRYIGAKQMLGLSIIVLLMLSAQWHRMAILAPIAMVCALLLCMNAVCEATRDIGRVRVALSEGWVSGICFTLIVFFLLHSTQSDGMVFLSPIAMGCALLLGIKAAREPVSDIGSARLLFSTSYASGLFFTLLVFLICSPLFFSAAEGTYSSEQSRAFFHSLYGALIGPLAIVLSLKTKPTRFGRTYLMTQIVLLIAGVLLILLHAWSDRGAIPVLASLLPIVSLLFSIDPRSGDLAGINHVVTLGANSVWTLIALFHSIQFGKRAKSTRDEMIPDRTAQSSIKLVEQSIPELEAQGIRQAASGFCRTLSDAIELAQRIGYPVTLQEQPGLQRVPRMTIVRNEKQLVESMTLASPPGQEQEVQISQHIEKAVHVRLDVLRKGDGSYAILDLKKITFEKPEPDMEPPRTVDSPVEDLLRIDTLCQRVGAAWGKPGRLIIHAALNNEEIYIVDIRLRETVTEPETPAS